MSYKASTRAEIDESVREVNEELSRISVGIMKIERGGSRTLTADEITRVDELKEDRRRLYETRRELKLRYDTVAAEEQQRDVWGKSLTKAMRELVEPAIYDAVIGRAREIQAEREAARAAGAALNRGAGGAFRRRTA